MSVAATIVLLWGGASVAGTFLMGAFLARHGWEHQPQPGFAQAPVTSLRPAANDGEPLRRVG